jgi:hypothetical protein
MSAMKWGMAAVAVCLAVAPALAALPEAAAMPQDALRSAYGQSLAFDDASTAGEHAIRVYDAQGKLVRDLDLADFLPGEYVRALPHDAAGLHWRREVHLVDAQQAEFSVPVPGAAQGAQALSFSIDLQDGTVRTSQIREYLAAADQARRLAAPR